MRVGHDIKNEPDERHEATASTRPDVMTGLCATAPRPAAVLGDELDPGPGAGHTISHGPVRFCASAELAARASPRRSASAIRWAGSTTALPMNVHCRLRPEQQPTGRTCVVVGCGPEGRWCPAAASQTEASRCHLTARPGRSHSTCWATTLVQLQYPRQTTWSTKATSYLSDVSR